VTKLQTIGSKTITTLLQLFKREEINFQFFFCFDKMTSSNDNSTYLALFKLVMQHACGSVDMGEKQQTLPKRRHQQSIPNTPVQVDQGGENTKELNFNLSASIRYRRIQSHQLSASAILKFSHDGQYLLALDSGRIWLLSDARGWSTPFEICSDEISFGIAAAVSSTGRVIVLSDTLAHVYQIDEASSKISYTGARAILPATSICIDPLGRSMCAYGPGCVQILNLEDVSSTPVVYQWPNGTVQPFAYFTNEGDMVRIFTPRGGHIEMLSFPSDKPREITKKKFLLLDENSEEQRVHYVGVFEDSERVFCMTNTTMYVVPITGGRPISTVHVSEAGYSWVTLVNNKQVLLQQASNSKPSMVDVSSFKTQPLAKTDFQIQTLTIPLSRNSVDVLAMIGVDGTLDIYRRSR
jgi:hypothetical protein